MRLENYQYDSIMQQYDARRMKAKYLLDKRTEEIYNNCPEILAIDNQMAEDSIKRAKRAISGDTDALKGIEEDNLRLLKQKQTILVKNGYPEDYLTLQYECPICRDTGFVEDERCSCFNSALSKLIYEESNVRDIIASQNFDTFDYNLYSDNPADADPRSGLTPRQNIELVVKKAKEFIADFDKEYSNLLIYGETGVGKTFLVNCIARELLDSTHTVLYHTAYSFFDYIEKCRFGYDNSREEIALSEEYLIDCDLLIIDDLGTELTNRFTASAFYSVLNERQLKKHPTIISTNLSFDDLEERYSERILSRISKDFGFLKIIGDDIRKM